MKHTVRGKGDRSPQLQGPGDEQRNTEIKKIQQGENMERNKKKRQMKSTRQGDGYE